MYLLVDIGNSRIKWLYGSKVPGIIEAVSYKADWRKKLMMAWHLLPEPNLVALSSVNSNEIEEFIVQLSKSLWQKEVIKLTPKKISNSGVKIIYEKPETLGTDRYLAMMGARSLCDEPLCVVGCGTALTLDVIDNENNHLGGLILPGIRLAENALLQNTKKLVPMRWTAHPLGKDTGSCIGGGIHYALPAGIDHLIDELETEQGYYFHRFAFGGDAQILFGNRQTYRIEPDLIFAGMLNELGVRNEE